MSAETSWISADWAAAAGVIAGTTLRAGGVSKGTFASLNLGAYTGDDADAVRENRQRFENRCGLPAAPRWLRQVHGSTVIVEPPAGEVPEADAAITRKPGVVCAVLTADCLPVIFSSADGAELAAAHAGWRGLADGVLEAAVRAMSTDPADLLAWLGPAISQAAFEVGGEVREQFLTHDASAADCFVRVSGGKYCTFSEPERFFSYRRDGACGRMASFVFRRS
jgi:YfiH family protein